MRNMAIDISCFVFLVFYAPIVFARNLWDAIITTRLDLLVEWASRKAYKNDNGK